MSRFSSFILGVIVGGAAIFVGLKYHVVRAEDGVHLIPKQKAEFRQLYVDIRDFGPGHWKNHPDLMVDIARANKAYLFEDAARKALQETVGGVLDAVKPSRQRE